MAQDVVEWDLAVTVPSAVPVIGAAPKRFTEIVDTLSGGAIKIAFHEPGELVPPLGIFDAVSEGSVEAGWAPGGFWAGKIKAASLFSAVPFGPSASEYLGWMDHGGGLEMWQEIMSRHDIHVVLCGITSPEASGWFREEITSLDDFRGLKMRFFGLGALVMEKLGVSTQLLAAPEIYPALERGVIDATEFSMPAIDLNLGFNEIAKHYYFPGWHQQATLVSLMVHDQRWEALSDAQKTVIEVACGDTIRHDIADGGAIQGPALAELQEKGVILHRWPEEILNAMHDAWEEVVSEQSAEDADFKRAWESLQAFRDEYAAWKDLGHLD
jgi:TRAP-type mannitol/chloroaromatic compound transport system substrate-binding protein